MFNTVKDLWHDYVCLHHSKETKAAINGVTQATQKFDEANVKLEGAVMHLILNGNGKARTVTVKPNGISAVDDAKI